MNCFWNQNKYLSYPLDKTLYWFCGANNKITIFQCESGEEWDSTEQKCSADVCIEGGIFADSSDTTKYYYCVLTAIDGIYNKYIQSCSTGLVFDGKRCALASSTSTAATIP